MGSDGVGVTTLVGGHRCPLDCKWCLNPQCKSKRIPLTLTVHELYERVRIDSLYFTATGGGVTFGGGEPLLQAEFIREFILYTREKGEVWRFSLETCLGVDEACLAALDGLIDEYIVDIKDMDEQIYREYTGCSASAMKHGLAHLAPIAERVRIKTPLIPQYNSDDDTLRSKNALEALGFDRIERIRYTTNINKPRDL